jgi:hypothetical protein
MSRFEINPDTREPYVQEPTRAVRVKPDLGGSDRKAPQPNATQPQEGRDSQVPERTPQ